MPFDKGKKRKLIDACGHERCYACMFTNELCPLCNPQLANSPSKKCSLLGSQSGGLNVDNRPSRPHGTGVKTNGHFSTYMQSRHENSRDYSPSRPPRPTKDCCVHPALNNSCPTPPQGRKKFFLSPRGIRNPWGLRNSNRVPSDNALSDDEGGNIRPVAQPPKKSTQHDLYMRLGLLLGDGAKMSNSRSSGQNSHDSISSLASLEATTLASTNTSPVSTLTGSSEVDAHRSGLKDPSSDSVGSLMSMSSNSNCSSSPLQRRHSLTTAHPARLPESFKNRKQSVRRSARSGTIKGPIDPRVRFAEYRQSQLPLKPLFFEVPCQEADPLFVGRDGIVRELESCLGTSLPGVLVSGHQGTGKTALMLQLVDYSCFGRKANKVWTSTVRTANRCRRIFSTTSITGSLIAPASNRTSSPGLPGSTDWQFLVDFQIVEYLLDLPQVQPDGFDSLSGETALTVASMNGCTNVCSALVARGARITATNQKVI
ncbi:unnamed protein product [Nesidiocoris tenuis]|uniref:Uncharacterized protein n=1 Tax=Nesidiocoris tenuis TaxID=355587 RepID=A0A6H5GSL8_9HEMI|nr:unnamed protein product [Nesidiocoris tenuis]